jgi:Flp pilus assembly protein TadG
MVEFAFVGLFLVLLILGIVVLGVLLSFKQSITQAAAEGARAVVGISDDPLTPAAHNGTTWTGDERDPLVQSTLDSVVSSYTDAGCGSSGMTCVWKIHSCDEDTSDFVALPDDRPGNNECITVRVTFDNTGDARIFPPIPLVSSMEPETITSQSTARLQT